MSRARAAAVGFGLLTWTVAHVATLLCFAHVHPGFVVHYHDWVGPLAIAVLLLTVTSLATAGRALLDPPRTSRAASIVNGTVAPAVFVGVEFAEFAVGLHAAPPAPLLLLGVALHAVIGAISPVLWSLCLDRAHRLRTGPLPRAPLAPVGVPARPAQRMWTPRRQPGAWGSRAPPLGRVVPTA